jgi:hypothetical protein
LERAADLLERKLGVSISYEDPPWISNRDTMYAADAPANLELAVRNPQWRGPLGPRGGTVIVILPTSQNAKEMTDPRDIIVGAILNHHVRGNPGQFKLVQLGADQFSIIGSAAEDKVGRLADHVSPLDLRISFPEEERTLPSTIDLISQATAVRYVRLGSAPDREPRGPRIRIGAQNEPARDVLARALRIPGGTKLSFRLNYMPDAQLYVLGLNPVRAEVQTPTGMQLQTLYWPR